MMLLRRLIYMTVGGLVTLALVFGGLAVFAQTDDGGGDTAETQTEEGGSNEEESNLWVPMFPGRWGRHGIGGRVSRLNGDGERLAEALGISVKELEAAKTEARTAAVEQAVADGLITQEQADELLAGYFGGHHLRLGGDFDAFLANALGISIDELRTARIQAYESGLNEMVSADIITEEQAELLLAQKAVQEYVDIEAVQSALKSAYEDAVSQALADGVISQQQADQLLSNQMFDFHGFGRHHHSGRGGFSGFAPRSEPTQSGNGA